ncbi:MAG: nitroreductase [Clostridia bacterium]|nr:nitroreductase [Clostridia bacterium]
MTLYDAAKIRISRRSYDGRALTESDAQILCETVGRLNKESGLCMRLCVGEGNAFKKLRNTYGMFSGVNNYIILAGKDSVDTVEKLGYYGEKAALTAVSMGMGTCFVGATFDKSVAKEFLSDGEAMYGVVTVGYISDESVKEKFIRGAIRMKKRTVRDVVEVTGDAPVWFWDGVESALLAPSARNLFPTVFNWNNGTVTASVPDKYMYQRMDLGIAKLHFELAVEGDWEFSNNGRFFKHV